MYVIHADNVNDALVLGSRYLRECGIYTDSRTGPTLEAPTPVTTVYRFPRQRVLFDPDRRANPFFHLFEALWMLAGRDDLAFLTKFNKRMADYSDDGYTVNGSAYGYRWRHQFGRDLLKELIELLRVDPGTRRAYLPHWDGREDGNGHSLDFPCNVGICFRCRGKFLDMTVFNRSNDIIWGAYGANAVHFSILQEYVASRIDRTVGRYCQVSNSYHAYIDNPQWNAVLNRQIYPKDHDLYHHGHAIVADGLFGPGLDEDLVRFFSDEPTKGGLFNSVITTMLKAWESRDPTHLSSSIDWHVAGRAYLEGLKSNVRPLNVSQVLGKDRQAQDHGGQGQEGRPHLP